MQQDHKIQKEESLDQFTSEDLRKSIKLDKQEGVSNDQEEDQRQTQFIDKQKQTYNYQSKQPPPKQPPTKKDQHSTSRQSPLVLKKDSPQDLQWRKNTKQFYRLTKSLLYYINKKIQAKQLNKDTKMKVTQHINFIIKFTTQKKMIEKCFILKQMQKISMLALPFYMEVTDKTLELLQLRGEDSTYMTVIFLVRVCLKTSSRVVCQRSGKYIIEYCKRMLKIISVLKDQKWNRFFLCLIEFIKAIIYNNLIVDTLDLALKHSINCIHLIRKQLGQKSQFYCEALFNLASVYEQLGQFQLACQTEQQAIRNVWENHKDSLYQKYRNLQDKTDEYLSKYHNKFLENVVNPVFRDCFSEQYLSKLSETKSISQEVIYHKKNLSCFRVQTAIKYNIFLILIFQYSRKLRRFNIEELLLQGWQQTVICKHQEECKFQKSKKCKYLHLNYQFYEISVSSMSENSEFYEQNFQLRMTHDFLKLLEKYQTKQRS